MVSRLLFLPFFLGLLWPAIVCAEGQGIKVGVSIPLSGEAATYGADLKNAIQFAHETLAPNSYQLIFEDDKCSGKDAVSIAHRFKEIERVKFVLGPVCSGGALSAAPIYEAAAIPAIALGASAPALSQAGAHIFRMGPNDIQTGEALFRYIVSQGHKVLAVLSEETDYCQGLKQAVGAGADKAPIKMVYEDFTPGSGDFRSQILRLKRAGADGLFFNPQAEGQAINIVKQVRALNWQVPLYAAYYPSSPAFLRGVGAQAEGITYVDLPLPEEVFDSEAQAVYREFIRRYGKLVSHPVFFIYGFEAFRVMHKALSSGGNPAEFITSGRSFAGLSGRYSFDKSGDVSGIVQVIRQVQDGQPVRVQ